MSDETSNGCDDAPPSFEPGPSDEDDCSLDRLFATLANRRTRYAVTYFESASVDVAELDDVVDYVVERERAADESDDDAHRQRVAVALHHNCLPKLSDAAVADYDPRSKTVRYWGDDCLAECLELLSSHDES